MNKYFFYPYKVPAFNFFNIYIKKGLEAMPPSHSFAWMSLLNSDLGTTSIAQLVEEWVTTHHSAGFILYASILTNEYLSSSLTENTKKQCKTRHTRPIDTYTCNTYILLHTTLDKHTIQKNVILIESKKEHS